MGIYPFIPLPGYEEYPIDEMLQRVADFHRDVSRRRTGREFSDRPVPRVIIENALRAAGTAPSGANLQPRHFVVVSGAEPRRKDVSALPQKPKRRSFTNIVRWLNGLQHSNRWGRIRTSRSWKRRPT